jgi:hypothetical protein
MRQKEGLIRLQFFAKEVLGRDIGGVVMQQLVTRQLARM